MNFLSEGLDALGEGFGNFGEFGILADELEKLLGLAGSELLPLFAGAGEFFAVLGICIGMGLVAICLASLGKKDQRGGIGGLEAEGEVEQDEGVNVEMNEACRVQGDPYRDDDCLTNEEGRRAEESGEGLCLEGEPIVPKNRSKMQVGGVKTKVVLFHGGWRWSFFHGFK